MLKKERGSITVFTLTIILFFTIILMGIYITANNANKAQKNADTTIIDKYSENVNYINEIYNERKLENSKLNSNKAKVNWNGNNIQYSNSDEAIVTAQIDIKDENVDLTKCKCLVNNKRSALGVDANEWNSSNAIAVTNLSGSIQTTITAEKTYYIHLLVVNGNNSKEEVLSDALKIEKNKELISNSSNEVL